MSRSLVPCLSLLALAIPFGAGCDRAEVAQAAGRAETTPLATAKRFVEALNAADAAALEGTLTERAREELRSGSAAALGADRFADVIWGATVVDGRTARVPFRAQRAGDPHPFTVHLRREKGEWRVRALETSSAGGGAGTIDLETVGAFAARPAQGPADPGTAGGAMGSGPAAEAMAARMAQELADGLARAF